MKKALLLLLAITALFSCRKNDDQEPLEADYLIFGYFSCFCTDCCNDGYKITDGELFKGEKIAQKQYQFEATPLDASKYEAAKKLIDELPDGLFADNGKMLGCGGCLDQPVYYVEYKKDGIVYHWMIDSTMDLPDYLKDYAGSITEVLNDLK
jgi:hypothetical protein